MRCRRRVSGRPCCWRNLAPTAEKAVPALIRALNDRDPFIRDAAASALGASARRQRRPRRPASPCSNSKIVSPPPRGRGVGSHGRRSLQRGKHSGVWRPFDFRSLGREGFLRNRASVMVSSRRSVTRAFVLRYPFDASHVLSRIDGKAIRLCPCWREMARDPSHPARLSAALSIWRCGRESPDLIGRSPPRLRHTPGIRQTEQGARFPAKYGNAWPNSVTELKPAFGAWPNG